MPQLVAIFLGKKRKKQDDSKEGAETFSGFQSIPYASIRCAPWSLRGGLSSPPSCYLGKDWHWDTSSFQGGGVGNSTVFWKKRHELPCNPHWYGRRPSIVTLRVRPTMSLAKRVWTGNCPFNASVETAAVLVSPIQISQSKEDWRASSKKPVAEEICHSKMCRTESIQISGLLDCFHSLPKHVSFMDPFHKWYNFTTTARHPNMLKASAIFTTLLALKCHRSIASRLKWDSMVKSPGAL